MVKSSGEALSFPLVQAKKNHFIPNHFNHFWVPIWCLWTSEENPAVDMQQLSIGYIPQQNNDQQIEAISLMDTVMCSPTLRCLNSNQR